MWRITFRVDRGGWAQISVGNTTGGQVVLYGMRKQAGHKPEVF